MIEPVNSLISQSIQHLFSSTSWEMRQRYRAFYLLLSFIIILAAVGAYVVAPEIALYSGYVFQEFVVARTRLIAMAVGMGATILASMTLTLGYLRDGTLNPFTRTPPLDHYRAEVDSGASRQKTAVNQHSGDTVSPDQSEVETVKVALDRDMIRRLSDEAGAQDRKANLNLFLGGLGAIVALAVLGVSVFLPPSATDPKIFWMTAGARAGFSLTASIFAFFFLSTYRRNLTESRYFHNELTNIQSRFSALSLMSETKFQKKDRADEATIDMFMSLCATERNFILRKGETTTDLQQKDLDRQEHALLLAAVSAMAAQVPPSQPRPAAKSRSPRRATAK